MNQQVQQSKVTRIKDASFRKSFCLKPNFRYNALKPYCKELVYATDGYRTELDDVAEQLSEAFSGFDPDVDCIVPTGTGITNILVGYLLQSRFPFSSIAVAFFQKEVRKYGETVIPEDYVFYRFYPQRLLNLE